MANKFETATNNYGNNFSNNNGNHHYTTQGHNYDDSTYVLAKFNGQVGPETISSTNNGYPSNNVTTYGQGYVVTLDGCSHVDDYTQTNTLAWPNNINTKGMIDGTLSFSVDKTTVPASGGTVSIHMPDLKYTATRDTRGYRYVDVRLKPNVPSNPDTLDDDGTGFANATVDKTTYAGENRQGFLNYEEPRMDYVIYSSYGNKGDTPFNLKGNSLIYNTSDNNSPISISLTYSHFYDNTNKYYAYAYAPYHNEVKNGINEGVGWSHDNTRLEVSDNFLSTFEKRLTMSYQNTYWTISYDGVTNMPFIAAFEYQGTYGGVTSSTDIDNNLTSYDRSTVLHNSFPGIANSSTSPSYIATSYTISQPKATLTPSYMWSLPETSGTDTSNFDSKTGAKYVNLGALENKYMESNSGTKGLLTVAKQGHYMGYVTGNLDNSFVSGLSSRVINMDHGTSKEGTFGNLKWTDCENRTERFFNIRVSTKYDNCRNQNITSITNEYASDDKRKPEVTLKCRQLPARWKHPAIRIYIKGSRYNIPNDSRFDNINPVWTTYTNDDGDGIGYKIIGNETGNIDWAIEGHSTWIDTSTIDDANTKLATKITMPAISSPYVKSTVSGSISASASTTYVGPTKSDITITPTWHVNYTNGYDKGFDAAEWKYSFVRIEGWEEGGNGSGVGMSYSGVVPFNDFIVHLNKCEDHNYRYPIITLTASSSNSSFTLDTTTNSAGSEHSLADGAKSAGFIVSVPANPKRGTTWDGAVTTEPTETVDGIVSVSPGTLMNSESRSTRISFSNSFDTSLTSGTISNPNTITIEQGPDKWGGSDNFHYCIDAGGDGTHESALATSFAGVCVVYPLKTFSNDSTIIAIPNYTKRTYNIGKLKSKHQLEIIGIGSIASQDYSAFASSSTCTVNYSGYPDEEDEDDFTYVSVVHLYADNYSSVGITEGPNGTSGKNLKTFVVYPKATDYKVQYQLNNGAWQDSKVLSIGTNYGSTTVASCVANSKTGDNVKSGAFDYSPEWYSGSAPKYHKFKIRVVDNTDPAGTAFENPTQYTITQAGVDPSATSKTFTFTTSGTRCTTSTPSSVSGTTAQSNVGSFTVTPDSDPFYNYTSYTNGMVPSSFDKSNYAEGLTKDDNVSATHSGYVDFLAGTTINFKFGIAGSSNDYITWSRTGYIKYKFYYNYSVTCSSGASKSSGNLQSSNITSYPSANATNYYKRRLVNGSWSTSLTTTITSTGNYSVTGSFVNGSTEYSTSKRKTFSITVRTYTPGTEYKYKIPDNTGKMAILFYDGNGNSVSSPVVLETTSTTKYYVAAKGPSVKIQESHRSYKQYNTGTIEYTTGWSTYANTSADAYTISPSTYTFANPSPGQTLSKQFTLSVVQTYNGQSVNVNGASGSTATFSVRKIGDNYDEYRVTSITLSSSSPYETYNESFTVTPTFDYKVQKRTLNGDGVVQSDWADTGTKSGEVNLNETSHVFSNLVIDVPQTFTFTTSLVSGVSNATGKALPSIDVTVTRRASTVYRTVYKYTGSVSATMTNQTITAFDTNVSQSASATWTCTYWKRTDSRPSNSSTYTEGTWSQIDNSDKHGSINSSTYTFNNVPVGSSASTYGSASYTFTVTPPSDPSGLNDGTFTTTVYAYRYGKSYYNS